MVPQGGIRAAKRWKMWKRRGCETFDFQTFDTPKYERWLIIESALILVAFPQTQVQRIV